MRTIRDCKVCVVGGAGFLGSHLVNHLLDDRGCKVLVVDNLAAGRLEFVHERADFEDRDITCDEGVLRGIFKNYEAQYVFNYAAIPYVPLSYVRPIHVFNVNAMGAMKVIHAAQEAGVKAILQVSSAELYGEHRRKLTSWDPYNEGPISNKIDEEDTVIPHSSYGASKAAIDYFVQSAWKERRTPCLALRQFNCLGERETHPYVVPEIISQLFHQVQSTVLGASGGPVVRLGNNSRRDFMYAGDAVRIAVELLERGVMGEVYNLGSEESVAIYDLAQKVADVVGCGRVTVVEDESRKRPWEIWHLASSNDKIRSIYQGQCGERGAFSVRTTLEEALRRTVAYYEASGRKWCWEYES